MAASCATRYYHGSPGSAGLDVTGTTVRFKLADSDGQDSSTPLSVPVSGENLSWSKFMKVNFTSSPAGSITNLRFFVASPPTGINHYSWAITGYTLPSSADVSGITGYTDNPTNKTTNNYPNRTSASPLTINAGTVLSNPSMGEGSQGYTQHQLGVLSTYPGGAGPITAFTATFRYAET
jgi:hypothetical protein